MALLDTLHSRGLPQTTYPLRAVPSPELAAAQRVHGLAVSALREAELSKRVTADLRKRVDAAEAVVRECYTELTVRAMPPDELEALIGEHKPTDADRDEGALFHRQTFAPALIARCVYDDPKATDPALTADQWAQEMAKGSMSLGEAMALFNCCWQVNDRTPDPDIPKG
jgi:hypothetical protein